ncbi:glycosyl transferase family 1 (plasmid) [Deinococcus aetherius]|uniref:Glycosyl transferase family 1 n=1 Tax=Deinococcus aetherius TaxID=200252 RepID=A0ABM8AK00_9DEIO|nr:glycosyltransferase [Deinococcus aetherius]BDP44146.1 glycosyl transferase family 1 [Deinococcus aetherius]
MNILMAHNFYQQPGGEDQSFGAEAGVIESNGHQVIRHTVHNEVIERIGSAQAAMFTVWNSSSARTIARLIERNKVNIAHFQNTFPLISPAAYYAAQRKGATVIQSLRNYRLICANALLFRQGQICESCVGRAVPWAGIQKACYRGSRAGSAVVGTMLSSHRLLGTYQQQVDIYIAVSEFVKQKYVQAGFNPEQIVVKPNFVTPDPGMGQGSGQYALFVGRLSEEKGVATLLRAWATVGRHLPLRIVGDGPLEPAVQEATKQSSIEWLGRKSPQEVYDLMGQASVVVVPSEWYEPFGRVVVEAFAKGTPVIATSTGGITELVEHGRTGLLYPPGDAAALVQQVEWLCNHPESLAAMRYEARREYEAKYTAERNYQMLMDIYQLAIERNKERRK